MDDWKTRKHQLRSDATASGGSKALLVLEYGGSLDSPEVGRRYDLTGEELIIGRSSDAGIQVDRDSVSRRHARLSRQGEGWVVADLQSTNGSYINDMPIREHHMQSGELLKIGNAIFRFLAGPSLEAALADEQYRIAVSDGLTTAWNRRAFLDILEREVARAHRFARPTALCALDIDNCKVINDTHGHLTGDHIIKEMSRRILRRTDRSEVLCRYDGTQFLLLLPECSASQALTRAEELRQAAASETFDFEGDRISVTCSVGACALGSEADAAQFIRSAQELMLRAKRQGKNRVCG
jgi:diguanylate cyclase (GGDEF)-like protein